LQGIHFRPVEPAHENGAASRKIDNNFWTVSDFPIIFVDMEKFSRPGRAFASDPEKTT